MTELFQCEDWHIYTDSTLTHRVGEAFIDSTHAWVKLSVDDLTQPYWMWCGLVGGSTMEGHIRVPAQAYFEHVQFQG